MSIARALPAALILFATTAAALGREDGLVAHYDFEAGAGNVLHDGSGNGRDGKIVGAQWVTTETGHALKFDGIDDYVDCGSASDFKFKGSFSLALWAKHDSIAGWQDYVGNYVGGLSGYVIAQNMGCLHFHHGGLAPYTLDLETLKMSRGVWYHVAAVYDGQRATMKIYLDGLEAAVQKVKGTPKPSLSKNLFIGRYYDGRERFHGVLDHVRIYSRALSEAEMMALYAADQRSQGKEKATSVKPSEVPPEEDSDVIMGMRIEKAADEKSGIKITTTGAEFLLGRDGRIRCSQRIPLTREVVRINLPSAALPLQLTDQNDFACTVIGEGVTLRLQGDSLIILKTHKDMNVAFEGLFSPVYHAHKDGKWLFIDQQGGFGIYPTRKKRTKSPALKQPAWRLDYDLKKGDEVWVSVFPPRPYNRERSFESLAHEGGRNPLEKYAYPSDELIQSAARYCKVFAVHSYIWPGGDRAPWLIPQFVPSDVKRFSRMREAVRRSGMKLVLYVSPYYYRGEDFFGEIRQLLDEDKMDGAYFDGVSMDFRKSYRAMRHARRILGPDRILYVHCSSDPLGSTRIYCPFIDTYTDFILRGEAGRGGVKRDDFLRWICSGYNISNAIGYWCYYGSTGKAGYVHQVPTSVDIDAALRNHVRLWRTETVWTTHKGGDVDAFDKEYYSKLDKLRRQTEQPKALKPR